jgi:hypothetical protein
LPVGDVDQALAACDALAHLVDRQADDVGGDLEHAHDRPVQAAGGVCAWAEAQVPFADFAILELLALLFSQVARQDRFVDRLVTCRGLRRR